ncbi:hypothetical protein M758_UG032600 [Ceratodon purpureus]|nr:hypothetical protein M758_UG032600 [Ceratodon purpureus]
MTMSRLGDCRNDRAGARFSPLLAGFLPRLPSPNTTPTYDKTLASLAYNQYKQARASVHSLTEIQVGRAQ